jgi:hypothetical protein
VLRSRPSTNISDAKGKRISSQRRTLSPVMKLTYVNEVEKKKEREKRKNTKTLTQGKKSSVGTSE